MKISCSRPPVQSPHFAARKSVPAHNIRWQPLNLIFCLLLVLLNACEGRSPGIPEDAQAQKDAYAGPCDPNDGSIHLRVPTDYPTVKSALASAGRRDVVEIEDNHQTFEDGIEMMECTHLRGPRFAALSMVRKSTPDTTPLLTMADGSSIKNLHIIGYGEGEACLTSPYICQGTLIEVNNTAADVSYNLMQGSTGMAVNGSSYVHVRHNHFGQPGYGIVLRDTSSADIINNVISTSDLNVTMPIGIYMRDRSSARIRMNTFNSTADSAYAIRLESGVTSLPDIGTENLPGLNEFNRGNIIYLEPGYDQNVPLRGNCFLEGTTFTEMTNAPDPYAGSSNITRILDGHDMEAGRGIVDYRDFRGAESECIYGWWVENSNPNR